MDKLVVIIPVWADIFILTDCNYLYCSNSNTGKETTIDLYIPSTMKPIFKSKEALNLLFNVVKLEKNEKLKPIPLKL
jgi:hypothetical protein